MYDLENRPPIQAPKLSKYRKYGLLSIICLAQFIDVYNASAVVIASAPIAEALNIGATESVWTLSAYVVSFASFMMPMGKIADLWSAKAVFILGLIWVGAFSLGIAVCNDKITLFLLRAFAGLGAAASIPAALNLIVHLFPNEQEQHVALAAFGGAGELANVCGLFFGGVLLIAGWRWVFWLLPIVCLPMAVVSIFLIPKKDDMKAYQMEQLNIAAVGGSIWAEEALRTVAASEMSQRFDYVGSFLVIAAAVLTTFAMTYAGEGVGWARAEPIACLIIGLCLFVVFFWWEQKIDQTMALIPSAIWRIKNVSVLIVVSLVPYFWWYGVQYNYANIMQQDWDISSILTAVHFLPVSAGGGVVFVAFAYLPPARVPLKLRMVAGALIASAGTIMLIFAKNESWYWKLIMPGMFVGSIGTAMVFISANNSLLMSVPSEYSGVVGGIFNATLQLGAVTGLAINATIQSYLSPSLQSETAHNITWKGYQSSFIFMAVLYVVAAGVSMTWFKNPYSK